MDTKRNAAFEPAEKLRTMKTTLSNQDISRLFSCGVSNKIIARDYHQPYSWQQWRRFRCCQQRARIPKIFKKRSQINLAMGTLNHHVSQIISGTSEKIFWFKKEETSWNCRSTRMPSAALQEEPNPLTLHLLKKKFLSRKPKVTCPPFVSLHRNGTGLTNIGLLELIEHGGRTRNVRLRRTRDCIYMDIATNPVMSLGKEIGWIKTKKISKWQNIYRIYNDL